MVCALPEEGQKAIGAKGAMDLQLSMLDAFVAKYRCTIRENNLLQSTLTSHPHFATDWKDNNLDVSYSDVLQYFTEEEIKDICKEIIKDRETT